MFVVYVLWLMLHMLGVEFSYKSSTTYDGSVEAKLERVMQELESYSKVGSYPASLSLLDFADGSSVVSGLSYSVASFVDLDVDRIYEKAIVFDNSVGALSDVGWLTVNTCGTGSFSVTQDYCPEVGSKYVILSSIDNILQIESDARSSLLIGMDRFKHFYDLYGSYPSIGSSFTLNVGGEFSLASIVGYSGSSDDCYGAFEFESVVLGCSDLFSPQGIPVLYKYVSATQVELSVVHGHQDASSMSVITFVGS